MTDINQEQHTEPLLGECLASGWRLARCSNERCSSTFCVFPSMAADDTLVCPYCGEKLRAIGAQDVAAGIDIPDHALPFSLDKDAAKRTFGEWLASQAYVPTRISNTLWEITPVFIAQSWHSFYVTAEIAGCARVVQSRRNNLPTTKYVGVYSETSGNIRHVRALKVSGIGDKNVENLCPYLQTSEAPSTAPSAIEHALVELPHASAEKCAELSKWNAEDLYLAAARECVGMSGKLAKADYHLEETSGSMLLLPVWSFVAQDGNEVFLMNGQSGKIVGEVPVDQEVRKASIMRACVIGAVVSLALALVAWFACGGPTWTPNPRYTTAPPATVAVITGCFGLALVAAIIKFGDSRKMERRKTLELAPYAGWRVKDLHVNVRESKGGTHTYEEDAIRDALQLYDELHGND